ncbi:hypothetical protein L249_2907, partial [Ophiocordyceps polyrhachis-furcata BCC 54312]
PSILARAPMPKPPCILLSSVDTGTCRISGSMARRLGNKIKRWYLRGAKQHQHTVCTWLPIIMQGWLRAPCQGPDAQPRLIILQRLSPQPGHWIQSLNAETASASYSRCSFYFKSEQRATMRFFSPIARAHASHPKRWLTFFWRYPYLDCPYPVAFVFSRLRLSISVYLSVCLRRLVTEDEFDARAAGTSAKTRECDRKRLDLTHI